MGTLTRMGNNQPKPDAFEFAQRLNTVLDGVRDCPAMKDGRGKWVAKRYKVSQPSAHAWLHGRNAPTAPRAQVIAKDLGVRFEWLYFGEGQPATTTADEGTVKVGTTATENLSQSAVASQFVRRSDVSLAIRLAAEALGDKFLPPGRYAELILLFCDLLQSGLSEARVLAFGRQALSVADLEGGRGGARATTNRGKDSGNHR